MAQVPYTDGPLRDWPIFAEHVDRHLAERGAAGELELDDADFREEVIEQLQGFYQGLGLADPLVLSLFIPSTVMAPAAAAFVQCQAEREFARIRDWFAAHRLILLADRIGAAIELVRVRRRAQSRTPRS